MPDLARIEGASGDPGLCIGGLTSRGFIQEVREYMDTQLVTETFGADASQ